jgi:5-methylcytosine-specific restriction enzyme A
MEFEVGKVYSRTVVKEAAGLPRSSKGGNWDTGIVEHRGEFVIFANINSEGRTGHNYGNRWSGSLLQWYHKTGSTISWPSIERLLEPGRRIHVFCRSYNSDPFEYVGLANAEAVRDETPVAILWRFGAL